MEKAKYEVPFLLFLSQPLVLYATLFTMKWFYEISIHSKIQTQLINNKILSCIRILSLHLLVGAKTSMH